MDLVARCAVASLLVSHGVRADAEFVAVLLGPPRPPRIVRLVGAEVRGLNPDERSSASLVRKALAEEGLAERGVHAGVYGRGGGLGDALAAIPPPVFLMDEGGEDLRGKPMGSDVAFVLSDHRDFTSDERALLAGAVTAKLSAGPRPLQADQVVTVVHNELDRRP